MTLKIDDIKPKLGLIKAGPYVLNSMDYIEKQCVLLWNKAISPFTKGSKLRGIKVDQLAIK